MSILFLIAHPDTADVFTGMAEACKRKEEVFDCFFTGAGVNQLSCPGVCHAAALARKAVVCEHSWVHDFGDMPAPVELGSQTSHSIMAGTATHVVSL